jgi:uncharacterized membrane protein YczE
MTVALTIGLIVLALAKHAYLLANVGLHRALGAGRGK